jgi:hypothetical protein
MRTLQTFKRVPLLMLLILPLALVGCESAGDGPAGAEQVAVDDYDGIDLNQPFGGLTATDEEEAFGDPYLLQLEQEADGEEADDPLAADPEVLRLEAMAGEEDPGQPDDPSQPARPRFTFLRMTWGMLDGPVDSLGRTDESVDLLDWTGYLSVDRGIVLVRRVILFERPRDHLVRPRPDRRTVAWVSHTGRHYDGLLVEIIEPPLDPADQPTTEPPPPNMLHFETAAYSGSFAVSELPDLDEIFPVRPEGNAIHLTGFRLSDLTRCPKGFLAGIWRTLPGIEVEPTAGVAGIFRGRWVGLYGHLDGFVKGRWGYDDAGQCVFAGKWISRRGQFRGLLRGTWESVEARPGHGLFHGEWVNAAGSVQGVLGGATFHRPEAPGGFFEGRWSTLCDEDAVGAIE